MRAMLNPSSQGLRWAVPAFAQGPRRLGPTTARCAALRCRPPVPSRQLCSEPPKVPRGFEHFYPKSKQSAQNSKGQKSSGSGSGGPGGGGGGAGDGEQLASLSRIAFAAGSAGLAAMLILDSGSDANAHEISMQQFLTHLLATGKVRRLEVVNGHTVKVHTGVPQTSLPSSMDARTSELSVEMGTTPANSGSWNASNGSWNGGNASGGQTSKPSAAGVEPSYFFSIGSVEGFEEKLETVQRDLGLQPRDYVPVQYVVEQSALGELMRFVPSLLLIGFFFLLSRGMPGQMGGGGSSQLFNVGKSKAVKATKVNTNFNDVAGLMEAKVEVMEFVDFLKNPERYTKLGAKIPKGALLVGPPGCGKTLLARATAGESSAPFYSISGSDFIEMFVGVGPARVRDLFAQARANSPCLIFIDEIDAVGRARGKGGFSGGGNDERENTLNQLLIEMDGFNPSTGIVILAGTNRPDVLDQALLRPGRFDRQILVDKPDIQGRKEIFMVHLQGLKLNTASGETMEGYAKKMAALTPGFSGSEIANVCNEAALIAARRADTSIGMEAFDAACDRVIAGLEKKNRVMDAEERRVVAYHEAGHAITGWYLEHADPVMKVSIIPRGQAALGYSQSLPRDVALHTEHQLADMMCMVLGGRAAEQVIYSKVSSGAQNDLERVTKMAQAQVTIYGMSEKVGHLNFGQQEQSNNLYRPYSEKTARVIDAEVREIVHAQYERSIELLTDKRPELEELTALLLEKEVIGVDDLRSVLGERAGSGHNADYDQYINASWKPPQPKEGEVVPEA